MGCLVRGFTVSTIRRIHRVYPIYVGVEFAVACPQLKYQALVSPVQLVDRVFRVGLCHFTEDTASSCSCDPSFIPFLFAVVFEDILYGFLGNSSVKLLLLGSTSCKMIRNFIAIQIGMSWDPLEQNSSLKR